MTGAQPARSGAAGVASQASEPFARFYDATARAAYSLALRIAGTQSPAEAACEAAYLDLWAEQPAGAFGAPGAELTDRLMELVRARALGGDAPAAGAASQSEGAAAAYTLAATVRSALAALNAPKRKALELACFGGMSVAAIAEVTGEPVPAVRASLREALLTIGAMTRQEEKLQ